MLLLRCLLGFLHFAVFFFLTCTFKKWGGERERIWKVLVGWFYTPPTSPALTNDNSVRQNRSTFSENWTVRSLLVLRGSECTGWRLISAGRTWADEKKREGENCRVERNTSTQDVQVERKSFPEQIQGPQCISEFYIFETGSYQVAHIGLEPRILLP